ncbi:peptide MFS transporter [Loigolactobacillus coryniformis subsp. coryniformis]|uniref:Di-/tripeptide transporter n=1 Tax=Loigolactobacillus coryniformis subsp. torquens DSM 20004 = KCTC 3535 TaxID=1423822 RepID=A0A2D1KRJ8_9LACO|nr:peptide MFS transporter [Loigolactobacillus coryniformis]OEH89183.1 peptide ABC transporter permease [Loigolactobacillus coryniformis subsp. coryniformis]ATO44711.1 peptide ABC transporter permease [Loigolactobacillus coryniformis subsp. torquens DSM 20004 = KCTC 3535]ATO56483.1 peptide ABC transporter permease [Loigolactobacillus coryniformis subsp. coryniformis KCTC 3167 = DSM 20001]MDN5950814.1 peptide MFS transporter [Loigolactobacillus coryniformis]MDN5954543.1 peptide MFS transporter 
MNNKEEKTFLGQPRGLMTLFFTEFWERFSYYGMRALLVFYLIDTVKRGGLGFDEATGASIMSIYGSLVYMSSVIGGFIADRLLGSRRTVFWGGVLIMIGHIVLSLPFGQGALYGSIALIVLGTGLLKPNVSEMVGTLYTEDDVRRDSGFTIFVMGINAGSLLAPYVVGSIGQQVNYHLGFSLAAIGMFFGLIQYWRGGKNLNESSNRPGDPVSEDEKAGLIRKIVAIVVAAIVVFGLMAFAGKLNVTNVILVFSILGVLLPIGYFVMMLSSRKTTKVERSRVWAYVPLFIASVLFWSIEEQGSVVLALFAKNQTILNLGFINLLPSWFQSLNPLFIILYGPIFAWFWVKLGKHQPSTPAKFAYGLLFAGASFLVMLIPVSLFGQQRVSALWLVLSWAIVEIGEMLISPVGLSATTKLAPKAFQSQMMSMWFLGDAAAQAINAQIVRLYTPANQMMYFAVIGIITVVFGILLGFMVPKIKGLMEGIN